LGWQVSSAGDVNNDGYGDVIVGSLYIDLLPGRACVYLGNASGLEAAPIWTTDGESANARFGSSVAGAGDVNGDGYGDVIVGAARGGASAQGRVYVYFGKASGVEAAPAWTVDGAVFYSLGDSVGGLGDINNDGRGDVFAGDASFDGKGKAYVYTTLDLCKNVVCSALDQCHDVGVCDSGTGSCSNPSKGNGTACDDANGNTLNDVCTNGTCAGTDLCANVVCSALDPCHDAGVCDHATGSCSSPAKANGSACDDADPNTVNDACTAGACAGTDLCIGVVCSALDPCHDAGVCDHATGTCSNPNKAEGTACDDGIPQTVNDVCHNGACGGMNLCVDVVCSALDQCHVAGNCDAATGMCSNPAKADGASCDDNDANTVNDVCTTGVCAGSPEASASSASSSSASSSGAGGMGGAGGAAASSSSASASGAGNDLQVLGGGLKCAASPGGSTSSSGGFALVAGLAAAFAARRRRRAA
jgi:MYXO-CTERM domain-containing protein